MSPNQCEQGTEAKRSASLPSWMRYMPNPPWKNSSVNLNLGPINENRSESTVEVKEEMVRLQDGKRKKCTETDVQNGGESGADDSVAHYNSGVSPRSRKNLGSSMATGVKPRASSTSSSFTAKKRGKMNHAVYKSSSNPFSTSHIVLLQPERDSDEGGFARNSLRKRRRTYKEDESFALDDTAALFSFCKFNK